jgi:flagellar FliJ protein
MKKFNFPLQRLLGYRQQLFDVERGVLANMNSALQDMEAELESLKEKLAQSSEELNRRTKIGVTALEIATHKNYLNLLRDEIFGKMEQIHQQKLAIERQQQKVMDAKIDISAMEKLREKRLAEYNAAVQKADEQFIEEFVSNRKSSEPDEFSA